MPVEVQVRRSGWVGVPGREKDTLEGAAAALAASGPPADARRESEHCAGRARRGGPPPGSRAAVAGRHGGATGSASKPALRGEGPSASVAWAQVSADVEGISNHDTTPPGLGGPAAATVTGTSKALSVTLSCQQQREVRDTAELFLVVSLASA